MKGLPFDIASEISIALGIPMHVLFPKPGDKREMFRYARATKLLWDASVQEQYRAVVRMNNLLRRRRP